MREVTTFSKTLTLPINVWAQLAEIQQKRHLPDLREALIYVIKEEFDVSNYAPARTNVGTYNEKMVLAKSQKVTEE